MSRHDPNQISGVVAREPKRRGFPWLGMLDHEQPLMRMSAVWAIRETRPPGGEEWLRERLEVEQDAGIIQRIEFALMRMAATERAAC
jgi:hypothetical protein